MGINQMTGTPWHVETIKKSEEDIRRHKMHCKYYIDGICTYKTTKCNGSSHCEIYNDPNNHNITGSNLNPNNEKPYYPDANTIRHLKKKKCKNKSKKFYY